MSTYGKKADNASLKVIGLDNLGSTFWNLTPSELVEDIVVLGQGVITDSGAIAIETGEFTGRSPQDRFIVCDEKTEWQLPWVLINYYKHNTTKLAIADFGMSAEMKPENT